MMDDEGSPPKTISLTKGQLGETKQQKDALKCLFRRPNNDFSTKCSHLYEKNMLIGQFFLKGINIQINFKH